MKLSIPWKNPFLKPRVNRSTVAPHLTVEALCQVRRENAKHTEITKHTKNTYLFVCFVIFVCFVFSLLSPILQTKVDSRY
jgi:hypothetical protein